MSDIPVTLGGQQYRMRPTYGAMKEIERRINLTFAEAYECALVGRLRILEMAEIIFQGCQAAGEEFDSVDAVGRAVFEDRVTSPALRESVVRFILGCLWSPEDAKKKWDDEAAPMVRPIPA
ncbi:GTA-gp10 family protein [Mangrovicoccus sp. HB161399]|uniref:GTA-gp10 family protein n=1 Tax=Mangrovicoccus sp. HB161399 TaxID=2720392 RepID=UPI0015580CC6